MNKDCPCHSGKRYLECCGRFHRGEVASTPEELMRSRYAAFSLGLGEYLVDTLASGAEDRDVPRKELARELSRARISQRFLGLEIVHSSVNGDLGEVLFVARIFERGQDKSFAELSDFVREGGAWKYLSGILLPTALLPSDRGSLTLEQFRALTNA